jgi:type IV secretory pathway VirB6-like protein
VVPDPPLFGSIPFVGWAILAAAAVVVVWIVLQVVFKAIKMSIRLAILIAVLALAGAGLCWLSSALGGLPL